MDDFVDAKILGRPQHQRPQNVRGAEKSRNYRGISGRENIRNNRQKIAQKLRQRFENGVKSRPRQEILLPQN